MSIGSRAASAEAADLWSQGPGTSGVLLGSENCHHIGGQAQFNSKSHPARKRLLCTRSPASGLEPAGEANRTVRGGTPMALTFQPARSGYLERMARAKPEESVRVPIGLKVSEADAARAPRLSARPEFVGWTRSEWCREIIRSALRYYVGDDAAPEPDQARSAAPSVAPRPAPPSQPPLPRSPAPAVNTSSAAIAPTSGEPTPAAPGSPAQPECPHPPAARDYETGTCTACGAVLWD